MPNLQEIHLDGGDLKSNDPICLDAKGSQCPGPIMTLMSGLKKANLGQKITIEVTDPGFRNDVVAWCNVTQNTLVSMTEENGVISATIQKDTEAGNAVVPAKEDSVTLVIFSEEMDKGLAAFNIALGALAMGMKVQIFFTFWGLSLIRKKSDKKESLKDRAIHHIIPKGDDSLPLTHKNMFGLGPKFMERLMKDKNVSSLDFMIHLSKYDGVQFIACQMSMDLMDIRKEDLIDGVQVGGVATMIEYARKSNLNYFV